MKLLEGSVRHYITEDGKIKIPSYTDANGRVRRSRELKPRLNEDGYLTVSIHYPTGQKIKLVHRLLAETYIPNPHSKETVNHIDGIKTNNTLENLEWATASEQMIHAYKLKLKECTSITKSSISKSIGKPVKTVNKETGEIQYFLTARACSKAMGYSERWCDKIISASSGETKTYQMEYVPLSEVKDNLDKVGFGTLVGLVEYWSIEKGLHKSDPKSQYLKVSEEVAEIAAALSRGQEHELKDGIGDSIVTLIILAQQVGTNIEDCLEIAYGEIADRKGKMVDGIFVKESDL